jgi:hypothetical protein
MEWMDFDGNRNIFKAKEVCIKTSQFVWERKPK